MPLVRRLPRAAFFVSICLLVLFAAASDAQPVRKSPGDYREYEAFRLDNGLQVVVVSDPRADKAAASLDVNVGSSSDPVGREGLSHFLEHMLFLGTRRYPGAGEYQQFISSHGGSHNAYTAFENTNFFFDVDAPFLQDALDRFSQFFVAPLFDAEYVQRERNAVDAEYQSKRKDDGRRVMHAWKSQANPAHPFARYFGGNAETLADRPGGDIRAELIDFWKRNYSAERMTLSVLGREPTALLRAWVEQRFADISSGAPPLPVTSEPLFLPGTLPLEVDVEPVRERRTLSLLFPVPALVEHLDTRPTDYIGNLLGHEGKGSLLSLLKQRGWAEGLHAGAALSHADSAMFSIGISLTSAGLEHVDDIVREVFAYVDLLRAEGVQKRIFEENRQLAEIGFRFATPPEPQSAVIFIATNLQRYPPSEVLHGPATLERYDPDLIRSYLDRLRPQNLLLVVTAPGVPTDRRTRFYDAAYSARAIAAPRVADWQRPSADAQLAIPAPNEFVPEHLVVKPLEGEASVPQRIVATPLLEIWHQQDATWRMPRADFYFSVRTPRANASPRDSVLADLYVDVVNDQLNEFSYPALLAGLDYQLYRHSRGFSVRMSGYDEKQPLLLARLGAALRSPVISEARFAIAREELLRKLRNASKDTPYSQAMDELAYVMLAPAWSDKQRIAALEPLTVADLRGYVPALLERVSVVALAHGNLRVADARALGDVLRTSLLGASAATDVARIGVVRLRPETRYRRALEVDHADAAVVAYYQGGERSFDERARYRLLAQLLSAPFYTELRTEKQLGYVVFATPFPLIEVPGIAFVVQSPVADVDGLERAVLGFVDDFATRLSAMPAEEFERARAAVLARVREEDTSLSDRSRRYWTELDREQYGFDTRERLAESIEGIERESFVAFYRRALLDGARREFVIGAQRAPLGAAPAAVRIVDDVDRFKAAHELYSAAARQTAVASATVLEKPAPCAC